MNYKSSKGVTLIALTITIIVMLIVSSTVIYNTNRHVRLEKLNRLYNDIETINSKIDDYYLKYGEIPTIGDAFYNDKAELLNVLQEGASDNESTLISKDSVYINPNDGDEYYVIDLEKLDNIQLNYGYSGYNSVKTAILNNESIQDISDVYIINKVTHQVYYPRGILVNDYIYYAYNLDNNELPRKYNSTSNNGICKINNYSEDVKINNLKLYGASNKIESVGDYTENLWTNEYYKIATDYVKIDQDGYINIKCDKTGTTATDADYTFMDFQHNINSKLKEQQDYMFSIEVEKFELNNGCLVISEERTDQIGQFNYGMSISENDIPNNKLLLISKKCNYIENVTYMTRSYVYFKGASSADCRFRIGLFEGFIAADSFDLYENLGKYRIPIQVNDRTFNIYINEPLKENDYIDLLNKKLVRSTGTEEFINIPNISDYLSEGENTITVKTTTIPSKIELDYEE